MSLQHFVSDQYSIVKLGDIELIFLALSGNAEDLFKKHVTIT